MSALETSTSEPLKNYRKRMDAIKTAKESLARDESGGNLYFDVKGKGTSGGPTRPKVPRQGTGTEQPVIEMKPRNGG